MDEKLLNDLQACPALQPLCEFCSEFEGRCSNTFRMIYGERCRSRIVLETERFLVLPTLGQLLDGSLLLLPRKHIETLAELPVDHQEEFGRMVEHVRKGLSLLGHLLTYEHGAHPVSEGGCGIYHAHLHLIPVPRPLQWQLFLPTESKEALTIESALAEIRSQKSDEYLLIQDCFNEVRYVNLDSYPKHHYPSQYIRRRLVEVLNIDQPWDWREYNYPESALLETTRLRLE